MRRRARDASSRAVVCVSKYPPAMVPRDSSSPIATRFLVLKLHSRVLNTDVCPNVIEQMARRFPSSERAPERRALPFFEPRERVRRCAHHSRGSSTKEGSRRQSAHVLQVGGVGRDVHERARGRELRDGLRQRQADGRVLESVEIPSRFETRVEISDFTMCLIGEVRSISFQNTINRTRIGCTIRPRSCAIQNGTSRPVGGDRSSTRARSTRWPVPESGVSTCLESARKQPLSLSLSLSLERALHQTRSPLRFVCRVCRSLRRFSLSFLDSFRASDLDDL